MLPYISRRLLLIAPTLFGILLINFIIVQFTPGGPVQRELQQINDTSHSRGTGDINLPPEVIEEIQARYGFDKPAHTRFFLMLGNYLRFDFGDSFYRNISVVDLIKEKLPTSISLGLWSTLLIYFISIPLGIRKAVTHRSRFDVWTSGIIVTGYAIPGFLFAIILIVFFAGGSFFNWFPIRGLTSDNFDELSTLNQIKDYFWHITLPVIAFTISGFATLTLLTKNSFLEETNQQYAITAKAKGLDPKQVLYKHIFRNAMLIIIAGFPAAFVSIFFTGSILIEVIFSLDGIGYLSYDSILKRDYPVIFGTLYIFTLASLILKLISDLTYRWVDPRINFEGQ